MSDKFDDSLQSHAPLPSIIGDDFEHPKMLEWGLPLRYSEINWSDLEQRRGYCAFILWFLTQLVSGDFPLPAEEENPEIGALRVQLDQLHAELRENAARCGIETSDEIRSPFPELNA